MRTLMCELGIQILHVRIIIVASKIDFILLTESIHPVRITCVTFYGGMIIRKHCFLSTSKIAYKVAYYFSTTVSLAVKAVHESV